jgi:hypothetical protein
MEFFAKRDWRTAGAIVVTAKGKSKLGGSVIIHPRPQPAPSLEGMHGLSLAKVLAAGYFVTGVRGGRWRLNHVAGMLVVVDFARFGSAAQFVIVLACHERF